METSLLCTVVFSEVLAAKEAMGNVTCVFKPYLSLSPPLTCQEQSPWSPTSPNHHFRLLTAALMLQILSSQWVTDILCTLTCYLRCVLYRINFPSNISAKRIVSVWLSTGICLEFQASETGGSAESAEAHWIYQHSFISSFFSYFWRQWLGRAYAQRFGKKMGMKCRSPGLQQCLIRSCDWNTFSLGALQREGKVWCTCRGRGECESTKTARLAQMY